jgi:subtilase family serine protease
MPSSTTPRASVRFRPSPVDAFEERVLLSGVGTDARFLIAAAHELREVEMRRFEYRIASEKRNPAAPGFAHTMLVRAATPLVSPARGGGGGGGSPPPSALTPAEVRHIYGFDQINSSILGNGQKIAIVDAYDDPNIFSDADVFDKQFPTTLNGSTSYYSAYGAATTWLTQVYASGSKPPGNTGWGQEISIDVEWAHAIAPQAQIVLVEAASNSFANLLAADDKAVALGATVISNSWGGGESSTETSYDSHFTTKGVTFVFSAGDGGAQEYPAESPYVVAVGGTTLSHDSGYDWTGESGWSSGGGGVSAYEAKPSYQSGLSYSNRANPDIAYDADPNTGVAVYDSYGSSRFNPAWGQWGGTSIGAPQWSALLALADQGRVAAQKSVLDGFSQTLPALYAMTSDSNGTDLYDVTTGSNGVGSAGPGYDLVTGSGTPRKAYSTYSYLVNNVS